MSYTPLFSGTITYQWAYYSRYKLSKLSTGYRSSTCPYLYCACLLYEHSLVAATTVYNAFRRHGDTMIRRWY